MGMLVYHKVIVFIVSYFPQKGKPIHWKNFEKEASHEAVPHLRLASGRMLYGRSLLEDQRWFCSRCSSRRWSGNALPALIAGDVYDRQIAPVEAIQLFDETLLSCWSWAPPCA